MSLALADAEIVKLARLLGSKPREIDFLNQVDWRDIRNLREQAAPEAEIVVANLTRPLLGRVAERLAQQPRRLIAAGLLDEEANAALAAFAPLVERRRLSLRGWTALSLA